MCSTKLKGDISEQSFVLECLKRSWGVSIPVGDRLPYDVIVDVNSNLYRVQVKTAWYNQKSNCFVANARRSRTNRKVYNYKPYDINDFDVLSAYLQDINVWYNIPISVYLTYKSQVTFVEDSKRQRLPRSAEYREVWSMFY